MNIVLIGPAHPLRGGIVAYNERLAKALQDGGNEVVIYSFSLQYPDFLFPGTSQFTTSPAPQDLNICTCINSLNPLNWWKVGHQIAQSKPDLVIVQFWLPYLGTALGTILRRIKAKTKTKIIAIVHNVIPHEKRVGDFALAQYFLKPVDALLVMSQNVLEDTYFFDKDKPRLLSPHPLYDHFGAIQAKEVACQALNLDPKFRYFLFFGLIRDYKGLDWLIKAFADERLRNKGLKLLIAGEYYVNKDKYKRLIQEMGLGDEVIEVDQYIPDEAVAHYFNVADVVVQPYKNATQSGVTQIAYHFETPMIVTNVGALAEMCPHEKVGYVVEPNPQALADALYRFITENPDFSVGIQNEKQKYSWQILVENLMALEHSIGVKKSGKTRE